MIHWFLRDSERFKCERASIEELARSAKWLVGTEWCLDGGLCLNAVIRAHDHDYEVQVSFPALFPDAPIVVRPRNMEHRISTHQYGGASGPLCLEWGPDNWHRDITAVQMLESAYRLFETENPLGQDRPEVPIAAPSRHRITPGQELRGEWARWCETAPLRAFLTGLPVSSVGGLKFSFRKTGEDWIALIHEATPLGGTAWKDEQTPTTIPGAQPKDFDVGVWFKTDLAGNSIGKLGKLADLKSALVGVGGETFLATDGSSPVEGFQRPIAGVLVADREGISHFFVVLSGDSVVACSPVRSDDTALDFRSPTFRELAGKRIGIVGVGSAGSKISVSLARMGVRNFYLVDHDVLLPENLRRNALDWQGVAQHKVDAAADAIGRVAADAKVEVCRLHIAGQESNAAVGGTLDKLAGCDLLIDATANPRVFNLLAAVARTANRPMVWMEVFGGGIGGLVARSRPGLDPTPHDMRGAYLEYCTDHPDPTAKKNPTKYATETDDGEVLVASDADISIIAHHAARFVPDCFLPAERSKFPNSMYLVGLDRGWVFEAPFVNVPISMASFSVAGWSEGNEAEITIETAEFVLGLLPNQKNATAPAD